MRPGILLLCVLTILFSSTLFSQTIVTIGTVASTSSISGPASSTTAGARNDRHMCIYSVAELTAAGITAGTPLMNIAWEKTGAAFYNEQNLVFRVWLKHNASTTFPASPDFATETGTATLVFETNTGSIPAAAGWITFPFNQVPSFAWNGTQNLQVITELIRSTDLNATGFLWRTITSVTNAAANANAAAATPPATLTRTGTRPQIRLGIPTTGLDAAITGMPNPVSGPAGLQNISVQLKNTGTVTLTSADINWTINGGAPTLFAWTGSLAPGTQATVVAGTNNFANGTYTIEAIVSNPNGSPDVGAGNNNFSKQISVCSPLAGAYTINSGAATGGTNFNSFTDFSNALSGCGVSGAVTATVAPGTGPYIEQVVFQNIPGSGIAAPISIQGSDAIITSAAPIIQTGDNPDRHIVRLINLSYFTIDNLNVQMVAGSTGFIGIHILYSGDHITISNCSVDMGTGTSTLLGGIAATGSRSSLLAMGTFSNLLYNNNTTTAGGYGAVIYGASNTTTIANVISNNTFTGTNSNGVYVFGTGGTQITGNTVNFAASNGIQLAQQDNINNIIQGNWISCTNATTTGTLRGIYVFGSNPGSPNKVINNVIRNMNAPLATIIGITNRTTGAEFYFNTVVLDNAAATGQRCFGFEEDLSNLGSILRNNIFYITQGASNYAAAIALASTSTVTTTISSNYNTFFTANGAHVAVRKGTLTTNPPTNTYSLLTDWQTASGGDANSFQTDPQFQAGTAIPQSGVINGQGIAIAGITIDILGVTRSTPPDPGAYEFAPPAGDAAITAYVLPTLPHCGSTLDVQFRLTNAGADPLNTVTINWSVNGVPQPVVNWAGPTLASGASTTVTLGNIPVASNTLYNFSATSSNPNGFPDVNTANDNFVYTGFRKGFDSPVTINAVAATTPTNFQSFQAAADQLALYGVCAPVVITVSGGPYTEKVTFNSIPGTNGTNTVTLNGNSQVLQFNVADMEDAVLQLSGVNYMIVENLTVNSTHPTDGRGIHITNNASRITIRNNIVNVSTTNSVSSSFGIIISGDNWLLDGSLSDSVVIIGNTVTGGYSSIQLSGEHWTQPLTRMRVANNTVLDWYGFGVYLSYTNGALVENNIIRRPTRTNSGSDAVTPAGITIPAGSLNFKLDKNRMYDFHMAMPGTTTISRGVHLSGTSIAPTSGTIQNNLIYGMTNSGAQYGIQNNSVNGPVNIWHNTIVLDGTVGASTSNTNAINMSNFSTQFDTHIENNVFVVTRGGTGIKRIIDVSASNAPLTSNYNVVWLNTTGGTQSYGQIGSTTYNTFADWQAGTSKDANSVFADPVFANPASGNYAPTNFLGDGSVMNTVSVGVPDDILGTPRSTNPDPGAYEFAPPPCNSAVGGTAVATATTFCATGSTTVTATGYSTGIGLSYQWEYSNDNFVANINSLAGQTNPATASTGVITTTTYYRLRVTCVNGPVVAYSNIVVVTINQPAVITVQPVNRTVCSGSNATFTVTATGALSYQWQLFDGTNWNNIAGQTTASLVISNATLNMNTNSYRVIVTGQCGPVTSNHATLYVNALPVIVLNASRTPVLLPGQTVDITSVVSPAGGSYVWYKDGAIIAGATGSSLTGLTVDDAGSYHLVYTDPNGCVSTSAVLVVSSMATGGFLVYPTPNNGHFHIRFFNTVGEAAFVSIYDTKGALVYRRQYNTTLAYTQLDISVPHLPAESYLVTVHGAGGRKIGAKWVSITH